MRGSGKGKRARGIEILYTGEGAETRNSTFRREILVSVQPRYRRKNIHREKRRRGGDKYLLQSGGKNRHLARDGNPVRNKIKEKDHYKGEKEREGWERAYFHLIEWRERGYGIVRIR